MRKIHFHLGGSLMLGALFAGCTVPGSDKPTTVVVAPSPVTAPPVVITPVPQVVPNPGLIQSTNPNDRLKQVKISNKDPFAANQPAALIVTNTPVRESGSGSGTIVTTNSPSASGVGGLTILTNGSSGKGSTSVTVETNSGTGRTVRKLVRANSGEQTASTQTSSKSTKKTSIRGIVATGSKSQKVTVKSNNRGANSGKVASSKTSSVNKKNTQAVKSGTTTKRPTNSGSNPTRPSVPVLPNDSSNTPIAVNPGIPSNNNPDGSSMEPNIPDTPSVPQLASQVEVRGIVQLDNGYSYAIVRGPNEKSSANVSQGDTVPNTGILIKRIEVGQDGGKMSGTVILEENGLEVARAVGDKVAGAGDEAQPTQGGANTIPNEDAPPPGHDDGNSGTQPFNTPTAQPVNTPTGQPVPNPTQNVPPTPIQSVVPTPIQSPGFSSPIPTPPVAP